MAATRYLFSFLKLIPGIFLIATGMQAAAQDISNQFNAYLSLEKKDQPTQNLAGAILYEGEVVEGNIIYDDKNWDGKTKFYCYVFLYTDNHNNIDIAFPSEGLPVSEYRLPVMNADGSIAKKLNLFEGVISPPYGKDNYVLLMTEHPIANIHSMLSTADAGQRSGFKSELIKLIKGSRLSAFYDPALGAIKVRTLQLESRPAAEKSGLTKGSTQKKQVFQVNDSAEIFYTPNPQVDIVRDSFPTIEVIDPSFDTVSTKGFKKLSGNTKKILVRGIAVDWKRGLKKIMVNNSPVTTYREASGYFDHLIEPVAGKNVLNISAENRSGYIHTVRVQFDYQPEKEKIKSSGEDHLLIIGINDYAAWPKLKNATRDAKDFRKLMEDQFGFKEDNIKELTDGEATRKKIYSRLREYVEELKENDRLLIYFSGHGYYDETLDMGYWIPADANERADDEYVGNLDITRMVQKMKARQIFLIADACYSGQLLRDMQKSQEGNYKSRLVLCSGKLQTVLDGKPGANSPFSTSVLEFFKNAKDQQLRATDLIHHVKKAFEKLPGQQAVGGAIDEVGDENGDFTFDRKKKN